MMRKANVYNYFWKFREPPGEPPVEGLFSKILKNNEGADEKSLSLFICFNYKRSSL